MKISLKAFAVPLLAVAACQKAPAEPSWATDVAPILAANCVRCHGFPARGGAPDDFRLDVYENTITDEGKLLQGAGAMAEFAVARVVDGSMPPRFPLDDVQVETLENWLALRTFGSRPPKGPPAPKNQPPAFAGLQIAEAGPEGRRAIAYEIEDPDGDVVVGTLTARLADDERVITRELHAGRGELAWDTAGFSAGSWQLTASLDDGSTTIEVDGPVVAIEHGSNAPPTVRIASPTTDALLADLDSPHTVSLEILDLDASDTLTVDVMAVFGDQQVAVASNVSAERGMNTLEWDTTDVPEGLAWQLVVTVSDGKATRTATSGPLIIAHGTTDETFDSMLGILGSRCGICHPGGMRIPDVPHSFLVYEGEGQVLGVRELRGRMYRRAIQERTMPPPSSVLTGGQLLSDEERARLAEWLLAGAPQ